MQHIFILNCFLNSIHINASVNTSLCNDKNLKKYKADGLGYNFYNLFIILPMDAFGENDYEDIGPFHIVAHASIGRLKWRENLLHINIAYSIEISSACPFYFISVIL